ncbi:division abnormally delayed protein [Scaptodrosophila lebanonensis]|uniref:Division abnormally delayed protein n=1 Tax=Drosophila lebanonensis TaxID=7225 RepID=A0A6J2UCA6_DROLE|nr:division abnormally delayed protein [Scaptodrosophila lebanonensis]
MSRKNVAKMSAAAGSGVHHHHTNLRAFLLFALLCSIGLATAKHLAGLDGDVAGGGSLAGSHRHHQQEQEFLHHQHAHQHSAVTHHRRRLQRDSRTKDTAQHCDSVKGYFESIDIKMNGPSGEKGAVCGGSCCNNATELELRHKATGEFERLLHHHTNSLRGILESTASLFQSHVLELAEQSENKTLSVFSTVYSRMVPLSRMMIHQLYTEIMNHLKYTSNYSSNNGQGNNIISSQSSLEDALHKFFVQLFPVAYHQAVHLSKKNYGELHEDYINCLKLNFDDLQPFGQIPKEIQTNLLQSVHMANIFMNALLQSAEVLSEVDQLYGQHLTDTCKRQLLKMSYCPSCNGQQRSQVKVCYSYCMNVLRGCSAQYAGLLDSPWSNVVVALDNLVTSHIRSDSGIMTTIKQLGGKLSEAIMSAMEHGPDLEKKVKKTCGVPNLLPSVTAETEVRPTPQQHAVKWASPPDAGIGRFLSTIDKSKEFYANIVNNICEDEDIDQGDRHCWTGERVGDYTQILIQPGSDSQRYNPEVPFETQAQPSKLNELVDKLIKIRKSIGSAVPSNTQTHDIQSDMGREGSGSHISDDDEEYGSMHGSGDGSGDGSIQGVYNPIGTTSGPNDVEPRDSQGAAPSAATFSATCLILTLVTILYSRCS